MSDPIDSSSHAGGTPEWEAGRELSPEDARVFDAAMDPLYRRRPIPPSPAIGWWASIKVEGLTHTLLATTDREVQAYVVAEVVWGASRYGSTLQEERPERRRRILKELLARITGAKGHWQTPFAGAYAPHRLLEELVSQALPDARPLSGLPRDRWRLQAMCPFCGSGPFIVELEGARWYCTGCREGGGAKAFLVRALDASINAPWRGLYRGRTN